jgi:hypothetical protein
VVTYSYCIDVHLALLRRLWTDFPSRREAMADAMGARGIKRRYVARTPAALFAGKSFAWAAEHSREFVDGWYADTNLNPLTMPNLLGAAVEVCGLRWGLDVDVCMPPPGVRLASR